jgi:GntP family gluconate:H+ symporter
MIIGSGVDMPYVGFDAPLLIASIPLAIVCSFWIVGRHVKQLGSGEALANLPPSRYADHGWTLFLPLIVLVILLIGGKTLPQFIPYIGVPLMFVVAGILGFFTGDKMKLEGVLSWAARESVPIMGLLAGIGIFIEILTLTGARGFIVVNILELPSWLRYLGMAVFVPMFGGVSAYGSASVLGVPLLIALLEKNAVIIASALSLLASVGDFLPPTRLAVILTAPVVREPANQVLKYCLISSGLAIAWGIGMMLLANPIGRLLGLA